MTDWPLATWPPRNLGVLSTLTLGAKSGMSPRIAPASLAWPTANRAVFVPFRVLSPLVAKRLFFMNGTTASGNLDIGIYDAKGTRIISTGSTAQAGTSVLQVVTIADTLLGAGQFYFAAALDNTTGTTLRQATGTVQNGQAIGIVQMASAFPLPATATFATMATGLAPIIGLSTRTVV